MGADEVDKRGAQGVKIPMKNSRNFLKRSWVCEVYNPELSRDYIFHKPTKNEENQ
jgi:hypothetical protein